MKKLIIFLLLTGSFLSLFFFFKPNHSSSQLVQSPVISGKPTGSVLAREARTSLFVPYWSLTSSSTFDDYDHVIYFGVAPGESGLKTDDAGYAGLPTFVKKASGKESYLGLRMLDSKQNFSILDNMVLQDRLIDETVALAKKNSFSGIVLDLEVSALPFDSLIKQITAFNKRFSQAVRNAKLHYAVTLYGDTFYRIRPFDVKAIGQEADEVMIMAYDLHKSRGNPGPNFPLKGKEKYGYDYERLIDQFTQAVSPEKLTVIFGFFGYDWTVDSKNNMIMHGAPLSYNEIKSEFLNECTYQSCQVKRDTLSSESSVTYVDDEGKNHLIWFDDPTSVAKKRDFLHTKGVSSYSYWAASYF